jgi:hypothetical protein
MTFEEILNQAIALLQRQGRVSYRALKRQFDLDEAYVEDLQLELIEVRSGYSAMDTLDAYRQGNKPPRSKLRGIKRKKHCLGAKQASGNRTLQGIEKVLRAYAHNCPMPMARFRPKLSLTSRQTTISCWPWGGAAPAASMGALSTSTLSTARCGYSGMVPNTASPRSWSKLEFLAIALCWGFGRRI